MQPGELEKLLASLETCPIQKKGLVWRLLKLYWKKLLFIALMLLLPGGLIVLSLCITVWALNWEKEMTAYFDKSFRQWKKDNDVKCSFDGWLDEDGKERV
jgi:hypothetical protein